MFIILKAKQGSRKRNQTLRLQIAIRHPIPAKKYSNGRARIAPNLHDVAREALKVVRVLSRLINVTKHAKVGDYRVGAQFMNRSVVISVRDMGVGFNAASNQTAAATGLGSTIVIPPPNASSPGTEAS